MNYLSVCCIATYILLTLNFVRFNVMGFNVMDFKPSPVRGRLSLEISPCSIVLI